MPHAVTHVLLTIIVIDIVRDYFCKKKFPRHIVLIGGIAGLLPDLDVPLGWLFGVNVHGTLTHTVLFGLIFFFLFVIFHFIGNAKKKKNHVPLMFLVISFGILFHLVLDCATGGYSFFWPFTEANFCVALIPKFAIPGMDAILLVGWLIHEEVKHKIKDYI